MFPDDYKKVAEGTLELQCSNVKLTRRSERAPRTISGPGEIRQRPEGTFELVIHTRTRTPIDEESVYSTQAGDLIRDDEMFSMAATDYNGHRWIADRVLISIPAAPRGKRVMVSGSCRELRQQDSFDGVYLEPGVHLRFPKGERLPFMLGIKTCKKVPGRRSLSSSWTRAAARFRAGVYKVCVEEHEDYLEVCVTGKRGTFHEFLDMRVNDALAFLTGATQAWFACDEYNERIHVTRLRALPVPRTREAALQPPAQPWRVGTWQSYWSVFAAFLKVVGPHKGELWHPLSAIHQMVLDSSEASLTSKLLVLSVAIESIAIWASDKLVARIRLPDKREIARLHDAMKTARVKDPLKQRALGLLSMLNQVRAADVLGQLVAQGCISREMLKCWRSARPQAAHGGLRQKDDPGKIVHDSDIMLALYYRLVLLTLGYKGAITDYSVKGWPSVVIG